MKKLDLYILRKFLGTFFFAILLIISISVVFDMAEKIDDFLENKAPLQAIVFDYFLHFKDGIPDRDHCHLIEWGELSALVAALPAGSSHYWHFLFYFGCLRNSSGQ